MVYAPGMLACRDYVDISIAVATPKGLVVPVLRNAHLMTFAGVEKVCDVTLSSLSLLYSVPCPPLWPPALAAGATGPVAFLSCLPAAGPLWLYRAVGAVECKGVSTPYSGRVPSLRGGRWHRRHCRTLMTLGCTCCTSARTALQQAVQPFVRHAALLFGATMPMPMPCCLLCAVFVQAINELGRKARDGTISIDDMAGTYLGEPTCCTRYKVLVEWLPSLTSAHQRVFTNLPIYLS
jgi:hypothetical protein